MERASAQVSSSARHLPLLLLATLGTAYMVLRMRHGWIASDCGMLAQTAERVLDGQVPHRDFDETYTGALSLLHAGAMAVLGRSLLAMRWVLLVATLGYLVSVYRLAARLLSPWAAAGVGLAALAWSVPNYFVALPTWYNLFFAVFGVHALVRHFETGRWRWLFASGLIAGLSLLFKIVALYVVAATLLSLLFAEQTRAPVGAHTAPARATRILLLGGLSALVLLVLDVVAPALSFMVAVHFVLPTAALAALLGARLRERVPDWRRLLARGGVYLAGVALPVAVFVAPYALWWGTGALVEGVVLRPQRAYGYFGGQLPEPASLVWALPWAGVYALSRMELTARVERWLLAIVVLVGALLLVRGGSAGFYHAFWASTRPLVPIVTVAGCVELARHGDDERGPVVFALVAHAALFSLVQFPFSAGIYFCFVSGLLLLAGCALVRRQPPAERHLHAALLGVYVLFALVWLHRGSPYMMGWGHHGSEDYVELGLPRAPIRVPPEEASVYRGVVRTVQAHSKPGDAIFATTDIPEVAFLTARENPTRTIYDVFDADYRDPQAHARRVLATLEARAVPVVVLHERGQHSGPPEPGLRAELERRYPESAKFDQFVVRWREGQ